MALICNQLDRVALRLSGSKWMPVCGQQIRNKKINLRTPQLPHYEKKLLLATCEPIMKRKSELPASLTCSNVTSNEDTEPHPYIKILADEFKEYLERSPFFAVFHLNSVNDLKYRDTRNALIKEGFILENYQSNVAELALKSTKYEPLLKFYSRSVKTVIAFGDKFQVKPLIALDKRSPFLILLFGVYKDRILRRDELEEIKNMPALPLLHAQLVYTLNSFGASLSSLLDHHGQQLSGSLDRYSKSDQISDSTNQSSNSTKEGN